MNSVFILLNSLNDWKPYCETDSLMTVTDYLEHRYGERTPKLVINLSDEYGYNSEGYYCSLLAQARGHGKDGTQVLLQVLAELSGKQWRAHA